MVFGNDGHQSCFRVKQIRIMLVENQPKSFHNSTITGNVTIPLKLEDHPSSDQVGLLYVWACKRQLLTCARLLPPESIVIVVVVQHVTERNARYQQPIMRLQFCGLVKHSKKFN